MTVPGLPVVPAVAHSVAPAGTEEGSARGIWSWPFAPAPPLVREFDMSHGPYGPGHFGIDLDGHGVVRAPADGIVRFAGSVAGRPVVSIDHAGGLTSSFDPVVPSVSQGEAVVRGQAIGVLDSSLAASSHCSPQLCLHVGARANGQYLDPLPLFHRAVPSVLKTID